MNYATGYLRLGGLVPLFLLTLTMKTMVTLLISFGLLSCKSTKVATIEPLTEGTAQWVGIVHVNENQCPVYIEITDELNPGVSVPFHAVYPLNLKDGMKKKGLKVQFSYTLSKAMSPEGCTAEAVIQLEQITVIP
jgi:hypothetical protein